VSAVPTSIKNDMNERII